MRRLIVGAPEVLASRGPALLAAAAVLFQIAMAVLYTMTVYLDGGPDEAAHLRYIDVIVEQRRWPVLPGNGAPAEIEAEQAQHPPLYYLLMAVPRALTRTWLKLPWSVVCLRCCSVLIGLCALPAVYLTARTLWPEHRWRPAVAVSLVSLLPMSQYMIAILNNSTLAMVLSALVVWLCARLTMGCRDRRTWVALGGCAGALMLTKLTGAWTLVLIGLVGVSVVRSECRTGNRKVLMNALLCVGLVVVIAGPWLARNHVVYGTMAPERVVGRRLNDGGLLGLFVYPEDSLSMIRLAWRQAVTTFYTPYWLIGPYAREMPLPQAALALALMSAAGLAVGLARRLGGPKRPHPSGPDRFLVSVAVSLCAAGLIVLHMAVRDGYIVTCSGRYFWEAVSAFALLGCLGVTAWGRPVVNLVVATAVATGLVVCSWSTLQMVRVVVRVTLENL